MGLKIVRSHTFGALVQNINLIPVIISEKKCFILKMILWA